jgi:tRNA A-37 threonylcarbamoyl transferase component Bud32
MSLSTHPLTPHPLTLLFQGAESHIYITSPVINHSTTHPQILKHRPQKHYRHPTLNQRLTRARTRAEARTLTRISTLASPYLRAPEMMKVKDEAILMSYLPFPQLKNSLEWVGSESGSGGKLKTTLVILSRCLAALPDFPAL